MFSPYSRNVVRAVGHPIRRSWLAILVVFVTGCTAWHAPELELNRSRLTTPTGEVPLEIGTKEHLDIYRTNPARRLIAQYEHMRVRTGVLPPGQNLIVESTTSHVVVIVEDEAFYRFNRGEKQPIRFSGTEAAEAPTEGTSHRFEFELPGPLSTYEVAMKGGSLVPPIVERIETGEGDLHEVYIPFQVDGRPFAIDLEFKVSLKTRRGIAAPATP